MFPPDCGNGSVVERCLAKANVASSNLVSRSKKKTAGQRPAVFFLERVLEGVRGKAWLCRRSHLSDSENPAEVPPYKHGQTKRIKGGNGRISKKQRGGF